jgi:uncharacterized protein (DUF302 family)
MAGAPDFAAYAYVRATEKSVADAAAAIKASLASRKYTVLLEFDPGAKFIAAGLGELSGGAAVRLMDVCHAPTAKAVLEAHPDVAFFLPCKVVVRRTPGAGGRTEIGYLRPDAVGAMMGPAAAAPIVEHMARVESDLRAATDEAAEAPAAAEPAA